MSFGDVSTCPLYSGLSVIAHVTGARQYLPGITSVPSTWVGFKPVTNSWEAVQATASSLVMQNSGAMGSEFTGSSLKFLTSAVSIFCFMFWDKILKPFMSISYHQTQNIVRNFCEGSSSLTCCFCCFSHFRPYRGKTCSHLFIVRQSEFQPSADALDKFDTNT